ncbi:radiation sensitive protein rad9 [Oleoguttula sp. CCFEE 5521]
MASVVENSTGSTSLDFSLLQQQLLEHHQHEPSLAASVHRSAMALLPEATIESANCQDDTDARQRQDDHDTSGEEIAEATTTSRPPRLITSHSAPPNADADNMAAHISSQRSWRTMRRAISLHGDEYGDTQSDSQMVRDFTESILHADVTPKKVVFNYSADIPPGENTYNTLAHVEAVDGLGAEQSDLVDLENALPPPTSPGGRSTTSDIEEELLQGPETQSQLVNGSAIAGDRFPNTPSLAGSKRRRSGEMLTSEPGTSKKTPGFSQVFGFQSKAPTITATQLFAQTQAPSSPMPNAPRSDPVLTRPSPGTEQVQLYSSPGMFNSSPALTMHQTSMFLANEPREQYTSMRESQERRAARIRREQELKRLYALNGNDEDLEHEDEHDADTQQRRLERKRLQKVLSDQAMASWNALGAPVRPGSRPSSSRRTTATIDLVTPATTRKNVQFELSDVENVTDEEQEEIELPIEVEDAHDGEGVLDEEEHTSENGDDIYDEFGETVLRSQRDPEDIDDTEMPIDEAQPMELSEDVSLQEGVEWHKEILQPVDGNHVHTAVTGITTTQLSAIADSQPDRLAKPRTAASDRPAGSAQISSFVPGSQYAGAAEQSEARDPMRIPDSTNRPVSTQPVLSREASDLGKLPSSPPVLMGSRKSDSPEAMHSSLVTTPARPVTRGRISGDHTEVPESDMPEPGDSDATKATSIFETAAETNDAPMFSTAPTHLSSQPTPLKPSLAKQLSRASASQQSSMPTPLKAAGVRRFADIAADPSPAGNGSMLDFEAIMGNVFTAADQEYTDLLSSPQDVQHAKKRKLTPSVSSRRATRQMSAMMAAEHDVQQFAVEALQQPVTVPAQLMQEEHALETTACAQAPTSSLLSSPPASAIPLEAVNVQNSAGCAVPASTPDDSGLPGTPESTRRREQEGANAASQLPARRGSRNGKGTKLSGTGRKTAVSRMLGEQAKPAKVPAKSVALHVPHKTREVDDVDRNSAKSEIAENDAAEIHDHAMTGVQPDLNEAPRTATDELPGVKAPHRVLALFRVGKYNAYYPATWLESSADGHSYHVRFDDQTELWVDGREVRALDFRVGDTVKVDFTGFAGKTWLVKEYGPLAISANDRENGTDVFDHVTLKVQARAAIRSSMAVDGPFAIGEGKLEEILITNIKLPHTLFAQLDKRVFTPPTDDFKARTRLATPTTSEYNSGSTTPTSRSRRTGVSGLKSAGLQTSRLREGSIASSNGRLSSGVFSGMAFAISYAQHETEKAEITRLIRHNGGHILEEGFDGLFASPLLDEPTTPSKGSPKRPTSTPGSALRLKPEFADLGFVALIADKHSRRAKYVQALSLGIPTLHGRWVLHSVTQAPKAAKPISWSRYLLPAGESAYLSGAVRSRTLSPYPVSTARFADTLAARDLLLDGAGVLLVASGKSKATWERRRTYAFLTLAIGAGNVQRVNDLKEAKALLASDPRKWSWVYVDNEKVNEAAEVLFGNSGVKRKRDETGAKKKAQAVLSAGTDGVRVVGDEFVVQSLILGGLVE